MEADDTQIEMENHLGERRQSLALSQKQLADLAGITRQAVSALKQIDTPTPRQSRCNSRALRCRVEDMFRLKQTGEIIKGELLGGLPQSKAAVRAQVAHIGDRVLVRPVARSRGELASLHESNQDLPTPALASALRRRSAVWILRYYSVNATI